MADKKVRVLVIDDQESFYSLLSEYAEMCRHEHKIECQHALGAEAALKAVSSWEPSIILLDAHLSGEDSYAMVHRLRGNGAAIVVTSDLPSREIEESAKAHGADGYLPKLTNPDDMDFLLEFLVAVSGEGSQLQ